MSEHLFKYYDWLRALHVIAVMSWMAGMLYLPRLFAYHVDSEKGSVQSETFKTMERRLLRIIINPAMVAAWLFGGLMLWANPILFEYSWMHVKLLGIVLMTGIHHVYIRWFKKFQRDENERSAKYYKIWNEVPAVLMIIIVVMAVAEPF